jgi:hypothetical protein
MINANLKMKNKHSLFIIKILHFAICIFKFEVY